MKLLFHLILEDPSYPITIGGSSGSVKWAGDRLALPAPGSSVSLHLCSCVTTGVLVVGKVYGCFVLALLGSEIVGTYFIVGSEIARAVSGGSVSGFFPTRDRVAVSPLPGKRMTQLTAVRGIGTR